MNKKLLLAVLAAMSFVLVGCSHNKVEPVDMSGDIVKVKHKHHKHKKAHRSHHKNKLGEATVSDHAK